MILNTDLACSWQSPTDANDVLECGDGNTCYISNDLGWDCCRNKGRNKCPANFPVMCDITKCGHQGDQYCCEESADRCNEFYGVEARRCDSTRRLF